MVEREADRKLFEPVIWEDEDERDIIFAQAERLLRGAGLGSDVYGKTVEETAFWIKNDELRSKEHDAKEAKAQAERLKLIDLKTWELPGVGRRLGDVLKERRERLGALRAKGVRGLAGARGYYRKNLIAFVEDWLWLHEPRGEMSPVKHLPFILWPKQREFLGWLGDRYRRQEDGAASKCRDMGVTWMCCAFAVWLWLFEESVAVGFGSAKEEKVDKMGDLNTILEKVRYLLGHLPVELLPRGFEMGKHAGYMKIQNPCGGGLIFGEAGLNIGRSGRASAYVFDEAAFIEQPEKVEASASATSSCKIAVSTFNGPSGPFAGKFGIFPAERLFRFNWRDDPRRTEEGQARKKREWAPWVYAQEEEGDMYASLEDVCIPSKYVGAAVGYALPGVGIRVAGLDVGGGGEGKDAMAVRVGSVLEWVGVRESASGSQTARWANAVCRERGVEVLCYDSPGVGAGVKSGIESLEEMESLSRWLRVIPVNTGSNFLPGVWDSGKTNKEMFCNLRAWLWWDFRRRLERTWEMREGVRVWSVEEMVSLPLDAGKLIAELSSLRTGWDVRGRIRIESKLQMKARGVKSPDEADAVMLAFCPPWIFMDTVGTGFGRGGV